MRKAGPFLAAALVLAVNILVLAGVAWNRAGEPDAIIDLTEQELPLAWADRDSTGVSLRLAAHIHDLPAEGDSWLDRRKLEDLGFDCSVETTTAGAGRFYRGALPRPALVVLEYGGGAWERRLAKEEQEIDILVEKLRTGEAKPEAIEIRKGDLERMRVWGSRLFPVDAGLSLKILRERYPDRSRYIVASAVIGLEFERHWRNPQDATEHAFTGPAREEYSPDRELPPTLRGSIRGLLVNEIHVPTSIQAPLAGLRQTDHAASGAPPPGPEIGVRPPRYSVTLRYGRRLEPWVESIRTLEAPRGSP